MILRKLLQIDDGFSNHRTATTRRNDIVAHDLDGGCSPETFRTSAERNLRKSLAHRLRALEAAAQSPAADDLAPEPTNRALRSKRLAKRGVLGVGGVLAALIAVFLIFPRHDAARSPLGLPHGPGIVHTEYPYGYTVDGRGRPTFDSYLDNATKAGWNDERPFLAPRVLTPNPRPLKGFDPRGPLRVAPGDLIDFSIFIHNDGAAQYNLAGHGSSVARNTRALVKWPGSGAARHIDVSAFLYADNAVVDLAKPRLHTISSRLGIVAESPKSIRLRYVIGSARLMQVRRPHVYQNWILSGSQEHWLFAGTISNVDGFSQITSTSGIGIGSDGSYRAATAVGDTQTEKLSWFACADYHGYVRFRVRVQSG